MEDTITDLIGALFAIFLLIYGSYRAASIFKIGGAHGTPRYKSIWDFLLQVMNIRERKY